MNHGNSAGAALIIGFTIQGLAIARALTREGIRAYALVRGDGSHAPLFRHPVLYTDNAEVIFAKSLMDDGLVDALLSARRAIPEQQVVLYAANDLTVLTLAKNWSILQEHYLLSWAHCAHNIECVVQKRNLPAYCDLAGVSYPKTVVIQTEADIDSCLKQVGLPILIKPDKQAISFKTHCCTTADELVAFVRSQIDHWPLVAQEWIEGGDNSLYFYTCFAEAGREYFGFTGRKVRTSPSVVGIGTIIETVDEPGVFEAARKLLPVLALSGPVAMEFKKDSSGKYWFIEANVGRTEFCVDLAIQAGFNLPHVEFNFVTGAPLPPVREWTECMWFDTDKEPFCYAHLCLKNGTLRPGGKKPVFPYHGQERRRVRAVAALEILRKFWGRAIKRLGSPFH